MFDDWNGTSAFVQMEKTAGDVCNEMEEIGV